MKKSLYIMLLASAMSIFVGSELSASQPRPTRKPLPPTPQRKPLPSTPTQPTQVEYPEEVTTLELPPTQVEYPAEVTFLELPPAKSMANLSAADKEKIDLTVKDLKTELNEMKRFTGHLGTGFVKETAMAAHIEQGYVIKGRLAKPTQDGSPRSDYIDKKLLQDFNYNLSSYERAYPANAKVSLQQLKDQGLARAAAGPQPAKPTPPTKPSPTPTAMPALPPTPAGSKQLSVADQDKINNIRQRMDTILASGLRRDRTGKLTVKGGRLKKLEEDVNSVAGDVAYGKLSTGESIQSYLDKEKVKKLFDMQSMFKAEHMKPLR